MSGYIGINGVSKKINTLYIGIDGLSKKVNKAYIGVDNTSKLWYEIDTTDPNTRYASKDLGTWSSISDVDAFCNTYNHGNNYTGLSLGNYVTIQDGKYNAQWEIAGFDKEDEEVVIGLETNGYGTCWIPKASLTTYKWDSDASSATPYANSDIHSFINQTVGSAIGKICGSHIVHRYALLGSSCDSSTYRTTNYSIASVSFTLLSACQITGKYGKYKTEYDDGEANYKLPLFSHEGIGSTPIWIRNVYGKNTDGYFTPYTAISTYLFSTQQPATYSRGIRPMMYLR